MGFLNSGWSTAIFLLGGLGLAVGLLAAMVLITSTINSMNMFDTEASFQLTPPAHPAPITCPGANHSSLGPKYSQKPIELNYWRISGPTKLMRLV